MSVITLTSDIGEQDYLVAAIKGVLLSALPTGNIIDISHQVTPFSYTQAAYIFKSAFQYFPSHTFHIILVDLFEKKPDQLLMAYVNEQYILCADNGLLNLLADDKPELVLGLPVPQHEAMNTLSCMKVFAKAIMAVQNGTPIYEIGNADITYIEKKPIRPTIHPSYIEAQILFIDKFENVILNVTQTLFEEQQKGRRFTIMLNKGEAISRISATYADVPEGEVLALFNSAGYLELAVNKGNAAGLFGLQGFADKRAIAQEAFQKKLYYEKIRIFFKEENE